LRIFVARMSLLIMRLQRVAIAFGLIATFSCDAGISAPTLGAASAIDKVISLKGGRNIALHCSGRGNFTVLLETGDGGRRTHMAKLFAALSKRYRVCDYDRRNIGKSSFAPLPRKAADLAADLFDTLSAAHVDGPFILFGTSIGGLLVRSYAAMHPVAGFVTSNQPGTSAEWGTHVRPLETPAQRAEDDAWASGGDNNEHIDVNDVSRAIEAAGPPTVPHVIMISTERYQCPAAGVCGPLYAAYVAASRDAADTGLGGSFRIIDGDHDLYITDLVAVVAAIDDVASMGASRH
jgi:pimeloyl-ACP methyl ester carboxylesterase